MTTAPTGSESSSPTDSKWRKLADNPAAVIALIFLVTGCLGIPVIMICRGFSPSKKVLWIVVSIVYTAFLFYLVGLVCMWSYGNVVKAMNGGFSILRYSYFVCHCWLVSSVSDPSGAVRCSTCCD